MSTTTIHTQENAPSIYQEWLEATKNAVNDIKLDAKNYHYKSITKVWDRMKPAVTKPLPGDKDLYEVFSDTKKNGTCQTAWCALLTLLSLGDAAAIDAQMRPICSTVQTTMFDFATTINKHVRKPKALNHKTEDAPFLSELKKEFMMGLLPANRKEIHATKEIPTMATSDSTYSKKQKMRNNQKPSTRQLTQTLLLLSLSPNQHLLFFCTCLGTASSFSLPKALELKPAQKAIDGEDDIGLVVPISSPISSPSTPELPKRIKLETKRLSQEVAKKDPFPELLTTQIPPNWINHSPSQE
ncbi:hypothetical protein BDR26DRAFT_932108 [Obelidium mucronatum]|nr:hypothetical protein BDR26DRAFT_932108 [Obelidium mucronatum]